MDHPKSRNSTVGRLMRWSWYAAVASVGVSGLLVIPLHMTTGQALLLALFAAAVGMTLAVGASGWAGLPASRVRPPKVGALCGAAAVAVTGLTLEVGPVALLLVVGLPAAGWWVHHPGPGQHPVHNGPHRSSPASSPGEPALRLSLTAVDVDRERISEMSTAELCLSWRRSYVTLTSVAGAPDDWSSVVELRRSLLDELERRDPSGFARWICTARAASDPGRFIPSRQQA